MVFLGVLVFTIAFVAISASPTNITNVGASCTITRFNQVDSVLKSCTNIVVNNLVVDAGKTLNLILKAGSTLTFEGTTTFAYAEWAGPLMLIKGDKITVVGAPGHRLDGRGAKWWDGLGDSGKKKPQFMHIIATGGSFLKNINIYDCPHQCVEVIDSDTLTIANWQIDSSAGDPVNGKWVALNTDGIGFTTSNNIIVNGVVVRNQDDCLVLSSGTNMRFTNLWCYGGHGLSVAGGISKTDYNRNVVRNIHFENGQIINSRNGIHIKSIADGGKGKVSEIYFSNILLSGITFYGISIEQNYRNNQGPSGEPNNNVPVDSVIINGLSGTMTGPFSVPVNIYCAPGGCTNLNWTGVNIQGNVRPSSCNAKPIGFNC